MKYIIKCQNKGMWGGLTSPLKRNGNIVCFDTFSQAQATLNELQDKQGIINNFNYYVIKEVQNNEYNI